MAPIILCQIFNDWFLIVDVRMMLLLAIVKQECDTLVLAWIMILVAVLPIIVMLTVIGMP